VARWRTKAVLAGLALVVVPAAIAVVVVHGSSGGSTERRAKILPVGMSPLRVKGTGFVPGERVRLKMDGGGRRVRVGSGGSFIATLSGVDACDSVTVIAVGSRGSRASFNLSQVACLQP
jgi:hypothetical protein